MKRSYFKYITGLLLFGSNGIVASFIHLDSYEIVLLRTLIGSFLLFAVFFLKKERLTFYKHKIEFLFLCISGVAMGTSWMFLYEAYAQIGVSIASLCYYCGPVIVMALSPLIFKEKLTWVKIVGFFSVLCGILFVSADSLEQFHSVWGLLCGMVSAVMYAVMVIFNKKAKPIEGLENAAIQLFVSFLTAAAFVGVKQGFAISIDGESVVPILLLGIINTGIGCYFYFSSIGSLPVQTVAVCGYIEPLSAVVFSALILGETMLPLQIVGAVLIIAGAIFAECFGKPKIKYNSSLKNK